MKSNYENGTLTIFLEGHIDSGNAPQREEEINAVRSQYPDTKAIVFDAQDLTYISSAGLRIILRVMKEIKNVRIINASSEVYEILDMTGFTEMLDVKKAYRVISVEGCEVIGQGANGKVYRIDPDTIVKVYMDPDSLPDIQRERELARKALILGIPTAIPYDVVRVGEGYGSVFELLNAKSFAKILSSDSSKLDEIVRMSVDLLKKIHGTLVRPGDMPSMKEVVVKWASFLKDYLPEDKGEKLVRLVEEVPEDQHMLHGDYHIKNVMIQNGEVLLIDMDTLCVGYPIFEFASIYNAYQGFSSFDHNNINGFLGITYEQGAEFWDKTLKYYFDDKTQEERDIIAEKAKLLGLTRIMRRSIRRRGKEENEELIAFCKEEICRLLEEIDTLMI
ncbi:MAG: anti-sigma factor antagonist [Solobacterium sp.]|nr:anti-sigma factor antagonist [Solobacterium sp.]